MKSLRLLAVVAFSLLLVVACAETRQDSGIDNDIEAALDSKALTGVDADVENGVATLTGKVEAEADRAAAETAARAVAGVKNVINKIELKVADAATPGIVDRYDESPDGWLTFKTKMALFADSRTSAYETEVTTVDGKVVLSGKVDTEQAKTAATEVARKIDGVKGVQNDLQVVAEARRETVDDSDDNVSTRAKAALEGLEAGSTNYNVEVNNGVVTLHGEAKTRVALSQAVRAIRGVPGVKAVKTTLVKIEEKSTY
ncbi:MAG: BON domain-containing protein [Acidobacteriota bacterium]